MFKWGIALAVVCVLLPPSAKARVLKGKHHVQRHHHPDNHVRHRVHPNRINPVNDGEIHIRPEEIQGPRFQIDYPPVDYPNATGTAVLDAVGRYRFSDRFRYTSCDDTDDKLVITATRR